MYTSANNAHYAQPQPHTHIQSEPEIQTFSQAMATHQPYSQRAELYAGQSRDSMPLLTTTHVHSAELTSLHSNDQRQSAEKETGTWMIMNLQTLKRLTFG
jgi:hypothetical protein